MFMICRRAAGGEKAAPEYACYADKIWFEKNKGQSRSQMIWGVAEERMRIGGSHTNFHYELRNQYIAVRDHDILHYLQLMRLTERVDVVVR